MCHVGSRPDRNLALELVRVTEAAAMGAGRWIGRGDKIAADQAAVDAMRAMLDTVAMDGVVVIGEGEKDEAPMLYNGEPVGDGSGPSVDVAVDPLEGTRLTALGQPNAIAVIALAERGSLFFPGAAVYMEKIAAGADAVAAIDINASPTENVNAVAKAKGVRPTDIRVVVLERDRHAELIGELRQAGARVNLIRDGDVAPAIAAAPARKLSMSKPSSAAGTRPTALIIEVRPPTQSCMGNRVSHPFFVAYLSRSLPTPVTATACFPKSKPAS